VLYVSRLIEARSGEAELIRRLARTWSAPPRRETSAVSTQVRFTQLCSAVKYGVPPDTRTG